MKFKRNQLKCIRIYTIVILLPTLLHSFVLSQSVDDLNYVSKPAAPLLLSRGNDFINLKVYKGTSSIDFLDHNLQIEKKLRYDEFQGYWDDVKTNYTVSGNTWSMTGLSKDYDYRFRSRIVNEKGKSPWSEPSVAMRVTAFDLLSPVNITVDSIETNAVTIRWKTETTRNLDPSHLVYQVQYRIYDHNDREQNHLPWIDYPVPVFPIKRHQMPEIQEITTSVDATSAITSGSFWLKLDLPLNDDAVIGTSIDIPLSQTVSKEIFHNATEEEFMDALSSISGLSQVRVYRYEPGRLAQGMKSSTGAFSWRVEFMTDSKPIPLFVAYKDTLDGLSDRNRVTIKRIFKGTQREFHPYHSIVVSGLEENQFYEFRVRGESLCCKGNWEELSTPVQTEISLESSRSSIFQMDQLSKYTKIIPGVGRNPGNQNDPDYVHGVGVGGTDGTDGAHGLVVIITFDADIPKNSQTTKFHHIGAPQIFTVPNNYACNFIDIKLWGAGGSGGGMASNYTSLSSGGGGAFAQSRFRVKKGEKLVVIVGGGGNFQRLDQESSNPTYFGGVGGESYMGLDAGQGGGHSAVFKQSGDLMVAIGGGGGGGAGDSATKCSVHGDAGESKSFIPSSPCIDNTCISQISDSVKNSPSPGGLGYGGKGSDGKEAGGGGGSGFKGGSGGLSGCGGKGGSGYLNQKHLYNTSSEHSRTRRLDAPLLMNLHDETVSISWSADAKNYGHTFAIEVAEGCSEDYKILNFVSSTGSFELNTTVGNLKPNTEYCLRYVKVGRDSLSQLSESIRIKTKSSPKNTWKPILPIHMIKDEKIPFNSSHSYCSTPVKPSLRKGHTISVLSDRIILFGGVADICTCFNQEQYKTCHKEYLHTNELWMFQNRLWTLLNPHLDDASYPEPREKHSATVLADGKILIIGGKRKVMQENKILQDIWQLDVRHDENGSRGLWSCLWIPHHENDQMSNMSFSRRYHHTAMAVNNDIFVFGGYSSQRLRDTWRFNYFDRTWTKLNGYDSTKQRWNGQSAVLTPFGIITFGGLKLNIDGMTSVEHDIFLYNIVNQTRLKLDRSQISTGEYGYPEDRHSSSVAFLKSAPSYLHENNADGLVIFGGERFSPQYMNDFWMLSLENLMKLSPSSEAKQFMCKTIMSDNDKENKWYWTCGEFGGIHSVQKCRLDDVLIMAWCKEQYNSFSSSW